MEMLLKSLLFLPAIFLSVQTQVAKRSDRDVFKIDGIFKITRDQDDVIGDFNKAGVTVNYQSGVMMAEAMRYAVEVVNNRTDFLYGYKLKLSKIFDQRHDQELSKNVLETFLSNTPFLVGPYSSETSYITSILTGTFRQVVISYGATYRDFDRTGLLHGYMVRTVPSDKFRIRVALSLVERLQWNYFAVIGSFGYNGERDARHFIARIHAAGICSARHTFLAKYPKSDIFRQTLIKLNTDSRLKAIMLFTTREDSRKIFHTIKSLKLEGRFKIVCMYGCVTYKEVTEDKEEAVNGTISVDVRAPEDGNFKRHFLSQSPRTNKAEYFIRYWQEVFNCSLFGWKVGTPKHSFCTGAEKLEVGRGYYANTPVHTIIDAVYAIAHTLRRLITHYCIVKMKEMKNSTSSSSKNAKCIDASDRKLYSHMTYQMLVNMSYIDGTIYNPWEGEVKNRRVTYDIHQFIGKKAQLVGSWSIARPKLDDFAEKVLKTETASFYLDSKTLDELRDVAVCSRECQSAYSKVADTNAVKARCCWTCRKCADNSVSQNYTCRACKTTEMVTPDNRCQALPERFIQVRKNSPAILILLLSVAGLISVVMVVSLFARNNEHMIVKSSGRDLCYMMLGGIALAFFTPFAYLVEPSLYTCVLRKVLPGLSFLVCYAPLFLKTNRIYRIFMRAKTSVTRPPLVSPQSQIVLFLGIVLVQLLFATISFVSKLPRQEKMVSADRLYLTLHCHGDSNPLVMLLNLALSVMFMVSCTLLAFKTRHFPKNYNEAKYIGITLYITCVVWSVFLPVYFLVPDRGSFIREFLTCAICIAIGYISLLGLFGRKCFLLVFGDENARHSKSMAMVSLSLSTKSEAKSMSQQKINTIGLEANDKSKC